MSIARSNGCEPGFIKGATFDELSTEERRIVERPSI